jgi:malonyl-CoA O-methyltransferase
MPQSPPTSARSLDMRAVNLALNRLAGHGESPWLHGEVARRMAERLQLIRLQPQRIIEWWPAWGGGHQLLGMAYPHAARVWVEPTPAWLEKAVRLGRSPWWSPRRWTAGMPEAVLEQSGIPGEAQLLWSNMMLHAVADPPALMARWQQLLAVDGFVMFSCLGPNTLRELRDLYRRLGWPSPTADFVDMHDLGDMLVQTGFADPVMDQERLTLTWADPGALLTELRQLGGNASPQRHEGLRTPRWRARLEQELRSLAGPDGRLQLSFEVAYGHAFKAAPRVKTAGVSTVSLDEMRALVRAGRAAD